MRILLCAALTNGVRNLIQFARNADIATSVTSAECDQQSTALHAAPAPEHKMCNHYTFNASRTCKKAGLLAGSKLQDRSLFQENMLYKGKSTNKADLRMVDWQLLPFKMHLSRHTNPQISMQAHTHTQRLVPNFYCYNLLLVPT